MALSFSFVAPEKDCLAPNSAEFAAQLVMEVAAERQFECLLTDDRELRRLNRSFLGHDYATDVLSFPSGMSGGFLGELAISVDRASEQASEFGHTLTEEIKILMLARCVASSRNGS